MVPLLSSTAVSPTKHFLLLETSLGSRAHLVLLLSLCSVSQPPFLAPPPRLCFLKMYLPSLGISSSTMISSITTQIWIPGPDLSSELVSYRNAYWTSPPRLCPSISKTCLLKAKLCIFPLNWSLFKLHHYSEGLLTPSYSRQKPRCSCHYLSTHPLFHPLFLHFSKPSPWVIITL